jgi:DNA-binding transcriptional LysR family regulator
MESIEDLNTFLSLAETGHMGRAARSLGLTQPALSLRLRKLEQRMGLRLFERHSSGMRLSQAGKDLLEQAKQTRDNMTRLGERVEGVRSGETREVRIGMTLLSGVSRVPALLRRVEQRAPEVRMVLHEAFSSPLEQLVADDELDLAFVHPPLARQDLTVRTLYSERMVWSVPASWTVPEDVEQRTLWLRAQRIYWVGPRVGPDLHRRISSWLLRGDIGLNATAEVSTYIIAQSFVAAGAGIALVPESVARLHGDETRVLDPGPRAPELGFAVVRRRRSFGSLYELICDSVATSPSSSANASRGEQRDPPRASDEDRA